MMLRSKTTRCSIAVMFLICCTSVEADVLTVADGDGADAFVDSSAADQPQGIDDEFRLRVRSDNTQRKTYLRFDLSSLTFDKTTSDSASLSVFGDEDDDINPNTMLLYGIIDGEFGDALEDWSEDEIVFNDAPEVGDVGTEAGEFTEFLSSVEFPEPPGGGRFPFFGGEEFTFESTPEFVQFVQSDTNDLLTMILIYEQPSGSSFGIESKEDGVFNPATLTVTGTGPPLGTALQAGDANQSLSFDQLDIIRILSAAKYLTGQPATWGEGDWDGAPGGEVGSPPLGNGLFDQLDIIAALSHGLYLTGPYGALASPGIEGDEQTSLVYVAQTGELKVDVPASTDLTSIFVTSASSAFIGDQPAVLDGPFDSFGADNIFKSTIGGSFGDISFGDVLPAGLTESDLMADLSASGSLVGGGGLGDVDLVYIPEPSTMVLLMLGVILGCRIVGRRPI